MSNKCLIFIIIGEDFVITAPHTDKIQFDECCNELLRRKTMSIEKQLVIKERIKLIINIKNELKKYMENHKYLYQNPIEPGKLFKKALNLKTNDEGYESYINFAAEFTYFMSNNDFSKSLNCSFKIFPVEDYKFEVVMNDMENQQNINNKCGNCELKGKQRCSKCIQKYCCRDCQKTDWSKHKLICRGSNPLFKVEQN